MEPPLEEFEEPPGTTNSLAICIARIFGLSVRPDYERVYFVPCRPTDCHGCTLFDSHSFFQFGCPALVRRSPNF